MFYFVTPDGEVREATGAAIFDPANAWPGPGCADIRPKAVWYAAVLTSRVPSLADLDSVALTWRCGPAYGAPTQPGTVAPLGYDGPTISGNWRQVLDAYAAWAARGDWYTSRAYGREWKPRRWALGRPSVEVLAARLAHLRNDMPMFVSRLDAADIIERVLREASEASSVTA